MQYSSLDEAYGNLSQVPKFKNKKKTIPLLPLNLLIKTQWIVIHT